jgi:hypothetical protein
MTLYRYIIAAALVLQAGSQIAAQNQQEDTLYIRYDDRFKANGTMLLGFADSIEIGSSNMKVYDTTKTLGYTTKTYSSLIPTDACDMMWSNPGAWLAKPNTYSGTNYMNDAATSGYNFKHSMESDHYAVFWDVRYGENPSSIKHPDNGSVASAYNILDVAEQCWNKYVELGFINPRSTILNKYKIQLYVPYQSEWRADASGDWTTNGERTGLGHFNPWAATARGGHTIAHEVGHTYQYLTHVDCGNDHGFDYGYGANASGGNGWWESCADWQAYKVFPSRQFTDGEYFEQYISMCHLNFMHEDNRYPNCFMQDWWVMKHGKDFIGRMWRESVKPEDPIEAYMRMCGLTLEQFTEEQMEGVMRMATWDIDGVRDAAANRIGQFPTGMQQVPNTYTWQVTSAKCPQNFGFNIINMNNVTTEGVEVKAHFKGIAGADGYRSINVSQAGWRYAFVAYTRDKQRVYGTVQSAAEGTATLTVPANCARIFFVVMGAPKTYWRHPWDDNVNNDEQWPYQVTFENTNLMGHSNH